jgi:hypothetical protein
LIPEELAKVLSQCDIGVQIGDKTMNVLMYADDIILLATNRIGLQKLVRTAEQWADYHRLKIHPQKTEYIIRGTQS